MLQRGSMPRRWGALTEMNENLKKAIFYRGDERTSDIVTKADVHQIEAAVRMLGEKQAGGAVLPKRKAWMSAEFLRDLSSGSVDCVVAI